MIKAIFLLFVLLLSTSCSQLLGSKVEGLEESVDGYLNFSGSVSASELQGSWKSNDSYQHLSLSQVFDKAKDLSSSPFTLTKASGDSTKNQNCEIDWSQSHQIKTRYLITFKENIYKFFAILTVDKSNTICSIELSEGSFSTYGSFIYLKEIQTVYEIKKTGANQINIGFTAP